MSVRRRDPGRASSQMEKWSSRSSREKAIAISAAGIMPWRTTARLRLGVGTPHVRRPFPHCRGTSDKVDDGIAIDAEAPFPSDATLDIRGRSMDRPIRRMSGRRSASLRGLDLLLTTFQHAGQLCLRNALLDLVRSPPERTVWGLRPCSSIPGMLSHARHRCPARHRGR